MNLTVFSIQRPVTTVMLFLSVSVIGIIAFFLLPIEYFPELDAPFIAVEVPYPNSTPEEVERQITRPIEEVLATIGDIKNMGSWSGENQANIWCEFDWGTNTDIKSLKAREKVDSIIDQLPADIERYYIRKWNTSDEEILALRLSSNRDLSDSYDMLDRNIKRRLERIDGVSRVTLYGVEKKEIRVQLDMGRLAAYHVDINRMVQTLMRSNFAVTAGKISDGRRRLSVRPIGEFTSVSDYENLIIGQHNLRLADVATITYTHPKLTYGRHLDQKYAIGLDVFKESGANTVEVTEKILADIKEIGKVPEMEGITIYEMDNQADGIISSLNELFKSGVLGAFLAIIVLYFFLRRFATTFIVTLAVPFSILVALAAMYFLNISLNILSMMGLLLAIGMLVDNAVVATESIHRHQETGEDVTQATISGVSEISLAITAGTFTTIIVFLPQILSTSDQIAIFLKHISIALCISLLASLIIAQTIVPLFASRLKQYRNEYGNKDIERLTRLYTGVLRWTLNHPRWTSLFIVLILFSIMIPSQFVKFDMFPDQEDDRKLRLHYNINDTYTVEEVERVVDIIEAYLFKNKEKFEINSIYTYYQADYGMSTILLNKEDNADTPQEDIMKMIREGLPPIAIGSPSFERRHGSGTDGGIQIQLIGKSSEELAALSKDVAWTLSKIPGLEDVRSEAEAGEKEIHVIVDRDRSRLHGFDSRSVANIISAALRGVRLRKFKTREGEIDVRVEFQDTDRQTIDDLNNMPLITENNRLVKLTSIADFYVTRGPQPIRRDNRISGLHISANLKDITVNEAREKISKVMNRYNLPPGYSWNFGRRFSYEEEAAQNMVINMLLAVALIYFVMAALFESLIFPAGIWSSILFSIVGVYWFFLLTDTTMTLMSMIGILVLIGVVVNNGIVLIDHIIHLRNSGLDRREAILQAGRDRMRPIIMTAATTIFSLLPLTIVRTQVGGDGPPYFPMARAIVGGLTFSTVVTLLILPTIYILLDNLRQWARRVLRLAG